MRSLALTAALTGALWLGLPGAASAQEPAPVPTTAPPPDTPAPPAQERAVPRTERSERVVTRQPERGDSGAGARRENANAEEGSRRRVVMEPPPAAAPAAPAAAAASDDQGAQRRGAVRRPPQDDGGRPTSGQAPRDRAVARTSPPPDRDRDGNRGRNGIYYYPDYWSYGRYYDPYYGGLHLGYLAYSPWGWTPAFYGTPYGAYGYPGYQGPRGWDVGSVKLKVKPRDAEVYVDGYFAGHVDEFDGTFQGLRLDSGGYRIEIRKPGFEPLHFDVRVQPDRTITFRGEMRPLGQPN